MPLELLKDLSPSDDDHIVQFYDRDAELVAAVADHLRPLDAGGTGLVVATRPHRTAIAGALLAAGADLERARRERRIVELDAADTLAAFMVDGRPDSARFAAAVGPQIDRLAQRGTPVRAFGEMVALLWADGHGDAAIALEDLWNDLAEERSFRLLCAYPRSQFTDPDELRRFDAVCRRHGDVLEQDNALIEINVHPSRHLRQPFAATRSAPREARQFVGQALRALGRADLVHDAALVVTEFAVNAVRHARSPFSVCVEMHEGVVTLAVQDLSSHAPLAQEVEHGRENGRGLHLVSGCTDRWGTEVRPDGKVVWAEFA